MYASVEDMVERYGETEVIRLSVAEGHDLSAVDRDRVEVALDEAGSTIDSYLRARHRVPLAEVPAAIRRTACVLARFDLAHGGDREPSEQMRLARKEALAWLGEVRDGSVELFGPGPDAGPAASRDVRISDRPATFSGRTMAGW